MKNGLKREVEKHVHSDIGDYKEEIEKDKGLLKKLRGGKKKAVKKKPARKMSRKEEDKVGQVIKKMAKKYKKKKNKK